MQVSNVAERSATGGRTHYLLLIIYKMKEEQGLRVKGMQYVQVDIGLLREVSMLGVPSCVIAYLLYCHLNSNQKPWFSAEPNSRECFGVASRTLYRWLNHMKVGGVIDLGERKKGTWPRLRFLKSAWGVPCGQRIGPNGIIEIPI